MFYYYPFSCANGSRVFRDVDVDLCDEHNRSVAFDWEVRRFVVLREIRELECTNFSCFDHERQRSADI